MYDNPDPETTARLELAALEKMLDTLCEHTAQLTRAMRAGGRGSREAELQREVFEERRAQAQRLLQDTAAEPYEIRITRLERLVEAVASSHSYFSRFRERAA